MGELQIAGEKKARFRVQIYDLFKKESRAFSILDSEDLSAEFIRSRMIECFKRYKKEKVH